MSGGVATIEGATEANAKISGDICALQTDNKEVRDVCNTYYFEFGVTASVNNDNQ